MSWTTPAAPGSASSPAIPSSKGAPGEQRSASGSSWVATSGRSSGSLAAVRPPASATQGGATGDAGAPPQAGQGTPSPSSNRLPPRSSTPPPKQAIVSILPGDDGDEVMVRLPRWVIAVAAGLVIGAGAFAWSRVTPDMSMFSRLFPAPPAEKSEQPVAVESPAQPDRATEQAEPQKTEPMRPVAPAEPGEPTPAANKNEDSAEVARRLQNRIEEKRERLAAARRNVSITMYSTSWCHVCKDARQYLRESGIAYDEYDVDTDRDADRRLRAVNPRHTVPTFDIDGAVLTGFSPGAIESMLTSAAARRAERE